MIALTRAGWLASAILFGALLSSILRVSFAGPMPFALLAGIALLAAVRPAWALPVVTGLMPVAWFGASRLWNAQAAWAEALACAALVGLAFDACRARPSVPRPLAAPASVFAAIVVASIAASLSVLGLRAGPEFWLGLVDTLSTAYFVDRSLPAVHAGLLLLEGTLLFAHAARLATQPGMLRRVCAATALGSAAAAIATLARLVEGAARGTAFWTSLVDLAARYRWNVHYTDYNAAGSYFALALLAGAAVAAASTGARRAIWAGCDAGRARALAHELAGRAARGAGAAAAALILPRASADRRTIAAGAVALAACAALADLGLFLPQRGVQKSGLLAADIRLGLIETGRPHAARVSRVRHRPRRVPAAIGRVQLAGSDREVSRRRPRERAQQRRAGRRRNRRPGRPRVHVDDRRRAHSGRLARDGRARSLPAARLRRDRRVRAHGARRTSAPRPGSGVRLLDSRGRRGRRGARRSNGRSADAAFDDHRRRGARARRDHAAVAHARGRAPRRPRAHRHRHVRVAPLARRHPVPRSRRFPHTVRPNRRGRFSGNARSHDAIRLEVSVGGRSADVLILTPDRWTDIVMPARTTASDARFRRMDLRTLTDEPAVIWVTKDEPLAPR